MAAVLMVTLNALAATMFALSVTCAINENTPAADGTPLSNPVWPPPTVPRVIPGGRLPAAIVHALKGATPPLAASVWEYAMPTVPAGKDAVSIDRLPLAFIVTLNALVADAEALSATRTVKLNVPGDVGAPLIPPVADSVSPGGNAAEIGR